MKTIRRLFFMVIFLSLMTGCSHQKWVVSHLDEVCPLCPADSVSNTIIEIKEIETFEIDTFWVFPEADSLLIKALAKCDSLNRAQMDEVTVFNNGSSATISIIDDILTAEINCHEDSLMHIIEIQRKELSHKEVTIEQVTRTITKEVKVGRFYVWFFWIVLILSILFIAYKMKFKSKTNG